LTETVADGGDVVDAASRGVGPLAGSDTPVLSRRVRVAGDEVDVKVGHFVAEYEAVDVLCALAVLERSAEPVDQHPQGGGLLVGQLPQASDVAFGFNHHVSEVHLNQVGREQVTGIHQIVFMDDPAPHRQTPGMFVADEAVRVSQALTSVSLE
jgi:hypothetical protein